MLSWKDFLRTILQICFPLDKRKGSDKRKGMIISSWHNSGNFVLSIIQFDLGQLIAWREILSTSILVITKYNNRRKIKSKRKTHFQQQTSWEAQMLKNWTISIPIPISRQNPTLPRILGLHILIFYQNWMC